MTQTLDDVLTLIDVVGDDLCRREVTLDEEIVSRIEADIEGEKAECDECDDLGGYACLLTYLLSFSYSSPSLNYLLSHFLKCEEDSDCWNEFQKTLLDIIRCRETLIQELAQ